MAFTGVAHVQSLGKYTVRITGLSLAGQSSGIIGLNGDTGADVQLPASFPSGPDAAAIAQGLDMTDLCECRIHDFSIGGAANSHRHQNQTLNPFRITIVNDVGAASADYDIYVQYLHSLIR